MRLLNNILNSGPFDMWANSIVLMYRGSIAHGTYMSRTNPYSVDDKDVFGIAIQPPEFFFGLQSFENFEVKEGEWDVLVYDFRKFIRLLLKMNPNVLQAIWTPEHQFLKADWQWRALQENRNLFVSKNIFQSFCGYSKGQLHKMESMVHNGYMGEKRKALVEKFGYDVKNAQHLIRLLRQGIEFLETGELVVERPDRQELIDIKHGKWSIDKVKGEAARLFAKMETAYTESKLPEEPDRKKIDKFVKEILVTTYLQKKPKPGVMPVLEAA